MWLVWREDVVSGPDSDGVQLDMGDRMVGGGAMVGFILRAVYGTLAMPSLAKE